MHTVTLTVPGLLAENATLQVRLEEAEEMLRAIRCSEVDALVVESDTGPRIYALQGVDAASNRFRGEILAQVSDAVIAVDGDRHVTYLNAAAERQYGIGASEALGQSLAKLYTSQWLDRETEAAAAVSLRGNDEWRGENVHVRHDGRTLNVESSVTVLRDTAGQPAGVLAVIRDITARIHAENRMRVSEIRYRRLFEAAQDGVLLVDPSTCKITDANPFMTKLLDYSHDQLVGRELFEIGLLKDEVASQDMIQKLKSEHQVRYEDLPLESQGGRHQDVEVVANLYDENGRSVIQCNIRDITTRKKVEEHNKLLMAEVNHRAKNLLSVVQAVARQTARKGDPKTFVERLAERIDGLAASQDLLVANQWQGVEVSDLVVAQLEHFKDLIGTRVLLDGPRARLTPGAAQGIGMALHELATNAGKYGALSNHEGRVRIGWQIAAAKKAKFLMSWSEDGGPAVAPPTHHGFGRMVIGQMVESAVHGKAEVDYRESGLSWNLSALAESTLELGEARS
jgi:PAS domain S-box-containing protein